MPSSLTDVLQRHHGDVDLLRLPAGPSELTALADVLDRLPDPRRVRGRRYRLGSLLALCLLAVLGGATTLAGIACYAVDVTPDVRERIGLRRLPRATTLGRLLARLDGEALDGAVGAWLARHATDPAADGFSELVGVAVDGKTVRGSRQGTRAAIHLLAAVLHEGQAVISQRQIAAKSNEIPAFAPLLERLDLRRCVITADAMHTQTGHAEHVVTRGGHYILVVKGNQKTLHRHCDGCPGATCPCNTAPAHRATADARSAGSRSAPSSPVSSSRTPCRPSRSSAAAPAARRTRRPSRRSTRSPASLPSRPPRTGSLN
ncbi:ISAs1 family transposase [Streptomyces sannanensis]|uniref:ISAs1 family transposase n=1 Tax=Streptomyces sannanensis TaxID=285536 RepID=UPI0031F04267